MSVYCNFQAQETVLGNLDPGDLSLRFTSLCGETGLKFKELEELAQSNVIQGIVIGTKLGTSVIVALMLWMISKNRKTPIFIINQVSLWLTVIHASVYLKNLLGRFASLTFSLTFFPQYVKSYDVHIFATASMFMVLIIAAIQTSLVYQVHVIFRADNYRRIGLILTTVSALLGITTVTMYLVTAIKSISNVYADVRNLGSTYYFNVGNLLMACSVNFMTVLLIVKLILAIRSRRFLGLKQFDSFHILLVVSTQTLLLPSIVYILAYSLNSRGSDTLASISSLLVTLSLPLSSMWATAANNTSEQPTMAIQLNQLNSETGSYVTGSSSYYARSLGSSKRSYTNKLYDLYPSHLRNRVSESGEDNTIVDVEKHTTISKGYITRDYEASLDARTEYTEQARNDDELYAQTPNTAAEEEAKKFWAHVPHLKANMPECQIPPLKDQRESNVFDACSDDLHISRCDSNASSRNDT